MQFFTHSKRANYQQWLESVISVTTQPTPKEPQYLVLPPDFYVINIGDDKFNQSRPPHKTKHRTHYYWSCNQRPQCKASIITIKENNVDYPKCAKFGFISYKSKLPINHNHEPKWTLSNGICEWSLNQMLMSMSLNPSSKPRATINNFILEHPMKALEFKNINNCTRRLYQARPAMHGVFPQTIEEIDKLCMQSKYSMTYHSSLLFQDKTAIELHSKKEKLFNAKPYHLRHNVPNSDIQANEALFAKAILRPFHQTLSLDDQNKIDEMYLGMRQLKLLFNNISSFYIDICKS